MRRRSRTAARWTRARARARTPLRYFYVPRVGDDDDGGDARARDGGDGGERRRRVATAATRAGQGATREERLADAFARSAVASVDLAFESLRRRASFAEADACCFLGFLVACESVGAWALRARANAPRRCADAGARGGGRRHGVRVARGGVREQRDDAERRAASGVRRRIRGVDGVDVRGVFTADHGRRVSARGVSGCGERGLGARRRDGARVDAARGVDARCRRRFDRRAHAFERGAHDEELFNRDEYPRVGGDARGDVFDAAVAKICASHRLRGADPDARRQRAQRC